jgi:hypothetical protein
MGVSGQRHAPAALYPQGKGRRYALYRGWVGLRDGLNTEAIGRILYLSRDRTGRPVRHYTDWATPAP